jgi:ubiquinone/menaquinone biosynthesis C-methylase UbiE
MADAFDPTAFTAQSKQSWSSVSESYDKLSAVLFPPITSAFLTFVQLRPGQLVLDVACGPGTLTAAAARAVGPSGRVVGVDLSPGMLKVAMGRATERNLEYREMNAEELDLPDSLFNAVLCQLGLMLFARPEQALREMTRVVKKGGTVACLVQGSPEKMLFTSLLMRAMVKHAPELKQPGAPNLYAFAPVGILDQALAKAGLWQIVSSRVCGVFAFDSAEDYWSTLTEGGGRSGAMLRSLPEDKRRAIKEDVLSQADALRSNGRVEIPYEVVMAKGLRA